MMDLLRPFLTASSVVAFALLVSACSPGSRPPAPTQFITANISPAIRTCANEPARLTGEFTQRDVAAYISRLRAAYYDCSGNLAAVNAALTRTEQELMAQAQAN